jgi:hypothetical protein
VSRRLIAQCLRLVTVVLRGCLCFSERSFVFQEYLIDSPLMLWDVSSNVCEHFQQAHVNGCGGLYWVQCLTLWTYREWLRSSQVGPVEFYVSIWQLVSCEN